MDGYTEYSKYSKELTFTINNKIANDFQFDGDSMLSSSSSRVLSPYCEHLYLDIFEIDNIFTANDIVEGLRYLNNDLINLSFINKFENVGVYYTFESSLSLTCHKERNLMFLLVRALSDIVSGLIYITQGGQYLGFQKGIVFTSDEFFHFTKKDLDR